MKAHDFEFDGRRLSSFGFIMCNFGDKGLETVNGAEIEFNTIPSLNGLKHHLVSSTYTSCLETVVQVCRHSCDTDIEEISPTVFREISKWLNRRKFSKFKLLDEQHLDLYYMASIKSVNRIEIDGRIMGLELNIITDSPHAYHEPKTITIKNTEIDGEHSINDTSYEEGYIYPETQITISEDGDLKIHNAIENRDTYIANCKKDEIITLDYPIIKSSDSSHDIQNNFNWKFFRIANTYENSRNDLTISLPCTIKLKYSPIVKVGL